MRKTITCVAFVLLSLAGCGSTPKSTQFAKDEAGAQDVRDRAEQARLQRRQEALEREVKTVPEWVVAPPHADHSGLYGVGIGSDVDLTNSMRKARLQSMYELAKAFKAQLSGEDTMIGSGDGEYRYIVDLFVNKVNLAGTEVVKQEVVPVNGVYKTYALLKYPFADFNSVLKSEQGSRRKSELEASYARLMKRLAEAPDDAQRTPAAAAPHSAGKDDTSNAQ